MRRISRATRYQPKVRVVFVDLLEHEMMDLKSLRKKVADAETRAHKPLDLLLRHWHQLPFARRRL